MDVGRDDVSMCAHALVCLSTCVRMHVSIKYTSQNPMVSIREVCIWNLPLPHPASSVSFLLTSSLCI